MTDTGAPKDTNGHPPTRECIVLELDAETARFVRALGRPEAVLEQLAHALARGMLGGKEQRGETDRSLRAERDGADADAAVIRGSLAETVDAVALIARQRADQVLRSERVGSDRAQPPAAANEANQAVSERDRTTADRVLERERSGAVATVEQGRNEGAGRMVQGLADERRVTDLNLSGERRLSDAVLVNARDANEQLVLSGVRLLDLAEAAERARARAEKSEQELRKVAEFREMFIGILGHDLRNPLGGIVIAAGLMLSRGRLSAQDAESSARIIRSAQRMSRLISQVLDLTRTRLGGGLPLDPKPTDLAKICENVIDEFEVKAELEIQGDVTGTWDPDRIAELLSNLIGNAQDYATPGTSVVVEARGEAEAVVVEIANQGAPIPKAVRPFIFEPFRQGQQAAKSAAGNLGLGLYISMQIVLAHGGTLDVDSAEGTTRFVFRLPRRLPTTEV